MLEEEFENFDMSGDQVLFLKPTYLRLGERTLEEVNQERERMILEGTLTLLGTTGIILQDDYKITPQLKLPLVNPATGLIVPQWDISFLFQNEEVPSYVEEEGRILGISGVAEPIRLPDRFVRFFQFQKQEDRSYFIRNPLPQRNP